MEVDLRHMRYFTVLAEEGHFGRAAKRLSISQPPLSQQIRRLEHELGAELFDRGSRPIRLTAAGTAFLGEAQSTLDQAARAIARTRRAARGETGCLVIGAIPWAYNGIVPSVVHAFRGRAPSVSLEFSTAEPGGQAEALRKEQADVGFDSPLTDTRGLNVEPLLTDPVVAIVPERHPLAKQAAVSLSQLAAEAFVSLSRAAAPSFVDTQRAMFATAGLGRNDVAEAPDFHAQLALVAAGVGVGLQLASSGNLGRRDVAFVPLEGSGPSATLVLLWRQEDDRELLRSFLDVTHQVARTPGTHSKAGKYVGRSA